MTVLSNLSAQLKKDVKSYTGQEVAKFLDENVESKKAIVAVLNFYEKMAIAIELDLADEELLKMFSY